MNKKNCVFIAMSLDGYIADKNGGLDWLQSIPNPENNDFGYLAFTKKIDALVMGRTTFETVCSFDIDWPYDKPVFVLSNSLKEIPKPYSDNVFLVSGPLTGVLEQIHTKGFYTLYIDGGATISSFLNEDLIDELILTTIPMLLGGGAPLFSELSGELQFELVESNIYLRQIVQNRYRRIRES